MRHGVARCTDEELRTCLQLCLQFTVILIASTWISDRLSSLFISNGHGTIDYTLIKTTKYILELWGTCSYIVWLCTVLIINVLMSADDVTYTWFFCALFFFVCMSTWWSSSCMWCQDSVPVLKEMCITSLYFLTSNFSDIVPCIVNDHCLHLEGHLEWVPCSFGKCVYTLGTEDSAVDAIERGICQLQMIGYICILH